MGFTFADIILPVAAPGRFTYRIPSSFSAIVKPGIKVTVQLGKSKLYSGIVSRVHDETSELKNIRDILDVPEHNPVINDNQLKLWSWMSDYYMCTEGEVMKAGVPSALFPDGEKDSPVEEIYKPREATFVKLARNFSEKELNSILDNLKRAPKQAAVLAFYLEKTGYAGKSEPGLVNKNELLKSSGAGPGAVEGMVRKGLFSCHSVEVGRLIESERLTEPLNVLNEGQCAAFNKIKDLFREKEVVLLHGITSSGKTEIYMHLIEEQLKLGKQVLYMLPEIGLTAQIIKRLQRHFGKVTGVYHSKFTNQEKVEIWRKVAGRDPDSGYRLILGVRSSLFLPFSDLGLVIIDEEHDSSYKQHDPAPRYHARDTAIVLAGFHKAKTLLGSASPSIESYYNSLNGKYGLVGLRERYGQVKLPAIIVANARESYRKKLMVSHFTPELLNAVDSALGKGEQVILFQNRRGFSPYIECSECGWIPVCIQCAVNLTYHKGIKRMVCHYCGYSSPPPSKCGNCGSSGLITRGFGTEKIEDEIKIVFPSAKVARLDQDTTQSRHSFDRILRSFEQGNIDILIGTQMISKGLDFDNLTVVGVLNADNLLHFPDFRAHERSYQLLEQVSGRAGRRNKEGKVILQTSDPDNRIIRMVLRHDYLSMFRLQAEERKTFNYPPFSRMINISLKHRDRSALNGFSEILGNDLKAVFGRRVLGPEFPVIARIQLWYIKNILIKIEKERSLVSARSLIKEAVDRLGKEKGAGGLRVVIDVDPY